MWKKILLIGVSLAAAYVVVSSLPDLVRYLKIAECEARHGPLPGDPRAFAALGRDAVQPAIPFMSKPTVSPVRSRPR